MCTMALVLYLCTKHVDAGELLPPGEVAVGRCSVDETIYAVFVATVEFVPVVLAHCLQAHHLRHCTRHWSIDFGKRLLVQLWSFELADAGLVWPTGDVGSLLEHSPAHLILPLLFLLPHLDYLDRMDFPTHR